MLLTGRNTYHNRKIMLLYAALSIVSFMLAFLMIMVNAIFKKWWLSIIVILLFLTFFFTFFLLALENNNYNIRYYYSKKKFNKLYKEIIDKYDVYVLKIKKQIKSRAKDYFYQYGEIDLKKANIEILIFTDWLEKHSLEEYHHSRFDLFCYNLLRIVGVYGDYRGNIKELIKIFDKEEVVTMLDKEEFISDEFKEKCMFIYDMPGFVKEDYLLNMYMELIFIIKGIIGLVSKEKFYNLFYNKDYFYSDDKSVACYINKNEDKYDVWVIDIESEYKEILVSDCKSIKEAKDVIKDNLNEYNERKEIKK